MDVIELGAPTEAQLAQWQDVVAAAWAHDRPDEPMPDQAPACARAPGPRPASGGRMWAAVDAAGRMCGVVCLRLPADRERAGEVDVQVLPGFRRRGIGTLLLAVAADGLRAWGCKTVVAQVLAGTSAVPFLEARGFQCVLSLRALLLRTADVDPARLAALVRAGRPGYRLLRWVGLVPDNLARELATAKRAMVEPPTGGPFAWDADRVRDMARAVAARGDVLYTVAALHGPAGAPRIAGFTEVVVPSGTPHRAAQHDTAVVPEHRGRRLGIWVKADMLRWLLAERPQVREIETENADDNAHMLAVNLRLGFRPVHDYLDYQADISGLPSALD